MNLKLQLLPMTQLAHTQSTDKQVGCHFFWRATFISHMHTTTSKGAKMHIKQITISNFRSFKQQPEIHPFSPGTNSVVGRNGSGKSNLFDAMCFVLLSPRFQTLRTVSTGFYVISTWTPKLCLQEQCCEWNGIL